MTMTLSPETAKKVQAAIEAGQIQNFNDFTESSLQRMHDEQLKIDEILEGHDLEQLIEEAEESIRLHGTIPHDVFWKQAYGMLEKAEHAHEA